MIITVTANAAVDKTLTVHNFQTGFRHRASESLTLPGGKGVNIARALKTLGQPVVVTGLVGGRAGQQIVEGLQRENILNDFVHIGGESRTSTAVVDPTAMTQTEIIEYGPVVTAQETAAFVDKTEYLAKGARFVVLAGSLPRKMPEDFYATVLQRVRRHRCFVVLDSAGEPLRLGMRGRPHLVLPNLREAEDLVGTNSATTRTSSTPPGSFATWVRATRSSRRNTAVWPAFRSVAGIACSPEHHPLESMVSTVGSGDAFLAGFVSARFQNLLPMPATGPRRRRRQYAALRRRSAGPGRGRAAPPDHRGHRARAPRPRQGVAARSRDGWG